MSTRIIVDVGSTHGGSHEECFKAIDNAVKYGVKDVKFQLLEPEHLKNGNVAIDRAWLPELVKHGRVVGVNVFASAWTKEAVQHCIDSGCTSLKFAYSASTLFDDFISKDKEMFIWDTTKINEVFVSLDFKTKTIFDNKNGNYNFVVKKVKKLFCIPEYPVINKICFDGIFDRFAGFSDHTLGIVQTMSAIMNGAAIIEKHVSQVDRFICPDNDFAVSWEQIGELVKCNKDIDISLDKAVQRFLNYGKEFNLIA